MIALEKAAALFHVPVASLRAALTSRTVKDTSKHGRDMTTPLNYDQALYSRDALAKSTYDRLFSWVVRKINDNIHSKNASRRAVIGVLDIYGFEILAVRTFLFFFFEVKKFDSDTFFPNRKIALNSFASTIVMKSSSRSLSSSRSSSSRRSTSARALCGPPLTTLTMLSSAS